MSPICTLPLKSAGPPLATHVTTAPWTACAHDHCALNELWLFLLASMKLVFETATKSISQCQTKYKDAISMFEGVTNRNMYAWFVASKWESSPMPTPQSRRSRWFSILVGKRSLVRVSQHPNICGAWGSSGFEVRGSWLWFPPIPRRKPLQKKRMTIRSFLFLK